VSCRRAARHATRTRRATASGPAAGGISRDERLRLARRIDWRFLLPSPHLGRVALVGPPDDELRAALAMATGTEPVDLSGAGEGGHEAFDTVVLRGRVDLNALALAAAAVAPHGRLIAEIGGPLPGPLLRREASGPGAAVRVGRALTAGGFASVSTWLTWPSHARAAAWARMDDRAAIRALVQRRLGAGVGGGTRAVAALAGRVAGTSAGAAFAPALTVVAERDAGGGNLIGRRLRDGDDGPEHSLLVLTPSYRASAHVVGLAIDAASGAPRSVAKVARLPDDTSLQAEAAVLGALGRAHGDPDRRPTLIDAPGLATDVGVEPWPILVETGLRGSALDPAAVRRDRAAAVDGVVGWLAGLPVDEPARRELAASERIAAALRHVERVSGSADTDAELAKLVAQTRPIVAALEEAPLPRVFEHGDPAHPNLVRLDDGRIGAVDWERGQPDGLPLHDLTIALAYVAAAARGATSAADQADAFRAAMTEPDPWARHALDRDSTRLGIDPGLRPALVVAAWARSAGWLAEHLAEGGPVDDGMAAWLVADRSVTLWRVALDLAEAD
jgi:hypothetical protein